MSAWRSAIQLLDTSCIKLLGGIQVTFTPQGGAPQQISALEVSSAMLDQYMPGQNPGPGALYLFLRAVDTTPKPTKGDQISVAGVLYVIQEVPVDAGGSALAKLRRNA